MIKILILNVGKLNKGNCALVDSTIKTIKDLIPGVEFELMGAKKIDSEGFHIKKIPGTISIKRPYDTLISLIYFIQCILINILRKCNLSITISKESPLYHYYNSDIIINSGGDTISGENSLAPLTPLLNIYYGILLDKPVILYGESLGYFKNNCVNYIARYILNKTKIIIVRENLSKEYLQNSGITNPIVYVTSDPAFLLEPITQSNVYKILDKEGIGQVQKPLIGINASGLISRYIKDNKNMYNNRIASILSKVIDDLIENLGANILMIPHVYNPDVDDRIAIKAIYEMINNKSNVYIIHNEYTAQELKGIIGLCDLFIGMRMHSTIASTSMSIPTVGIAYSHKMYGIIGEALDQDKYILDINEIEYETLIEKIYEAWKNREQIKQELDSRIPSIKEKALSNGIIVKKFIDERGLDRN